MEHLQQHSLPPTAASSQNLAGEVPCSYWKYAEWSAHSSEGAPLDTSQQDSSPSVKLKVVVPSTVATPPVLGT